MSVDVLDLKGINQVLKHSMSAYLCLPLLPYFDHIRSRMSLKLGDLDLDLQGQIGLKTSKILGLIF